MLGTDSGSTGESGPTDYVWNIKLVSRKDTAYALGLQVINPQQLLVQRPFKGAPVLIVMQGQRHHR